MIIEARTSGKFVEALLAELRGEKRYRSGYLGRLVPPDLIHDEINDALEQIGMTPAEITGRERHRTVQILRMENVADPIDAYEKAVCEKLQRKIDVGEIAEFIIKIPGWDDLSRELDPTARFIGTPDMHRARASQLRETENYGDAKKLEKLALMIELRDCALNQVDE